MATIERYVLVDRNDVSEDYEYESLDEAKRALPTSAPADRETGGTAPAERPFPETVAELVALWATWPARPAERWVAVAQATTKTTETTKAPA